MKKGKYSSLLLMKNWRPEHVETFTLVFQYISTCRSYKRRYFSEIGHIFQTMVKILMVHEEK